MSFTDLTIRQFFMKWAQTLIDILEEQLELYGNVNLVDSLFKEDRMVYIGFTVCLISFMVYTIDITS